MKNLHAPKHMQENIKATLYRVALNLWPTKMAA